ncbi:hypothetical protein ACNPMZ_00975 [Acinetobacter pittii]|uniref:hypothetical protein n=1 Tax=Acinetobacter TaxID=469 RepID=UPI000761B631|nr:hypothetical protein [Acinetobacter sp. LMB-5]
MYIQNKIYQAYWQPTAESPIKYEPAVIVALHRFVYMEGEELIELESNFFYDEQSLINSIVEQANKLKHINVKMENGICFYSCIKSFVDENSEPTGQLVDDAYSLAYRFHIGKMQPQKLLEFNIDEVQTYEEVSRLINNVQIVNI